MAAERLIKQRLVLGHRGHLGADGIRVLAHFLGRGDGVSRLVFKVSRAAIPKLGRVESGVPDGGRAASNRPAAGAIGTYSLPAFAHGLAATVGVTEIGVVAGGAGHVVLARQNRIVVEQSPQGGAPDKPRVGETVVGTLKHVGPLAMQPPRTAGARRVPRSLRVHGNGQ